MTDILKVLDTSLLDADFLNGNLQGTHQGQSIVIRTVGGAKSWHRYTYNTLTGKSQLIECLHTHQQGKSGIQSS